MKFGVITRIPDAEKGESGNMAFALPYFLTEQPGPTNDFLGRVESGAKVLGAAAIAVRMPVFSLGEVLILDADGREIAGDRRKPGKWDVDCETYDRLDEALARATALLDL